MFGGTFSAGQKTHLFNSDSFPRDVYPFIIRAFETFVMYLDSLIRLASLDLDNMSFSPLFVFKIVDIQAVPNPEFHPILPYSRRLIIIIQSHLHYF